jgi:hypothetical protein
MSKPCAQLPKKGDELMEVLIKVCRRCLSSKGRTRCRVEGCSMYRKLKWTIGGR